MFKMEKTKKEISVDPYWLKLVCTELFNYGEVNKNLPKVVAKFEEHVFSEIFYLYGKEVEKTLALLKHKQAIGRYEVLLEVSIEQAVPGVAEGVYIFDSQEDYENTKEKYKEAISKITIEDIDYVFLKKALIEFDLTPRIRGRKFSMGSFNVELGADQAKLLRKVLEMKGEELEKLDAEILLYEKGLERKNTRIRDTIKEINKKISPEINGEKFIDMKADLIFLINP